MPVQQTSRLLPYRSDQLFRLVLDIERYPEFVPGYRRARIVQRGADALGVEQTVGFGPATFSFHSTAEFQVPTRIFIHATDGPFRRLDVEWRFADEEGGCRVSAQTHYQLHGLLAPVLAGWLEFLVPRLLDAFAARAAKLYAAEA